jgi:hypothetical protein
MDREYRVLNNGTAVLITRQPSLENGEICVTFTGAPSGATAIFEFNGNSIYRLLEDGMCTIPANKLKGPVVVTIALLDGSSRPEKWVCEELMADVWENGAVLVSPNDANLPQRVTELALENEELRVLLGKLAGEIQSLKDKLESLYEGYDLV